MSKTETRFVPISEIELGHPSKWDIIPIHTSDRAAFKACRRKWGWSSPSRANLVPRSAVHGVRIPLWFGTGIHYALERYYDPTLREDPVTVWLAWFHLQWEGGVVTADEVKSFVDRNPEPTIVGRTLANHETMYKVDGLRDILPSPDEDEWMQLRDLGRGMMEFYKTYAEREDNFRTVAVEHDFSIPILSPQGKPLYMVDKREMPKDWEPSDRENFYGPLIQKVGAFEGKSTSTPVYRKQVHARGRMDKIIQELPNGLYGIDDYKTTARLDDDYFRHIELDEQCTTYLWAAEREAKMYNLEYERLDFIIYEALLKAYPKPPTPLKSGLPSLNRQTESPTAEMFEKYITSNNLKVIFDADPKMQEYYTWLLEKGDNRFVDRKRVMRNRIQLENAGIRLYYEALDMLGDVKLYPNPRKEYDCLNCVFRGPCIAAEDGSDFKSMLADGYIPNWDR